MRTSGSVTETNLTVATVLVAGAVVVFLAGGPSAFLLTLEKALKTVFDGAVTFLQNF